jgi:hypothetical protein
MKVLALLFCLCCFGAQSQIGILDSVLYVKWELPKDVDSDSLNFTVNGVKMVKSDVFPLGSYGPGVFRSAEKKDWKYSVYKRFRFQGTLPGFEPLDDSLYLQGSFPFRIKNGACIYFSNPVGIRDGEFQTMVYSDGREDSKMQDLTSGQDAVFLRKKMLCNSIKEEGEDGPMVYYFRHETLKGQTTFRKKIKLDSFPIVRLVDPRRYEVPLMNSGYMYVKDAPNDRSVAEAYCKELKHQGLLDDYAVVLNSTVTLILYVKKGRELELSEVFKQLLATGSCFFPSQDVAMFPCPESAGFK